MTTNRFPIRVVLELIDRTSKMNPESQITYIIFEHIEDHNSINPYQTNILCIYDTECGAKDKIDELTKFNLENHYYHITHYTIKPVEFFKT